MAKLHVFAGAEQAPTHVDLRRIGPEDVREAVKQGVADFLAMPTHLIFLGLIYPAAGVVLAVLIFGYNAFSLLFPLVSGFGLVAPIAALGLYELSRRREQGRDTSWRHAFEVVRSPAIASIVAVGVLLLAVFIGWLFAAQALYHAIFGPIAPESITAFFGDVLTTRQGWTLIVLGHLVGLVFATVAFAVSVISLPLLLDRDVGAAVAIETSVRAVLANPVPMLMWAGIVAGALILGSLPLLVGLAIVVPVLGHATWHLYRRLVPN